MSTPLKKDVLEGTVNDPRLGVVTYDRMCGTCQRGFEMCPGHWGYIELVEPCYNPVYGSWVVGVLQSVCTSCFRPRLVERNLGFVAYKEKAAQASVCPHPDCAKALYKFSFNKEKKTVERSLPKQKKVVEVPAREVVAIFRNLSDDVVTAIGLNGNVEALSKYVKSSPVYFRPEAMIYEVFPVCPLNITPPIHHAEGAVDDDIRSAYNRLIKSNLAAIALRDQVAITKKGTKNYNDYLEEVRGLTWVLSSPSPKDKVKSNRGGEIRSFPDRIKGKRGDKNSHVAGKRGDQTARGVISPGGVELGFGEVGVPMDFARVLTYPELVTPWNIGWWEGELKKGNVPHVRRGRLISVAHSMVDGEFVYRDEVGLKLGDEVHRYLRDGDYPWLGRQPSLRPESLQGLRAKIVQGDTILLPLAHTPAYGADFDGDEMTLYCPANAGRIEAMVISASAQNIVSVQHGLPIMALVQNSLIYASVLTNIYSSPRDVEESTVLTRSGEPGYQSMVSRDLWMDCITHLKIPAARVKSFMARAAKEYPDYFRRGQAGPKLAPKIPGKLALSIAFPANLTWKLASSPFNPAGGQVEIVDGILKPLSGPLCKKSIGRSAGGIVHVLWLQHPGLAARFITEMQYLIGVLGPSVGFSLGWVDCLTRPQSSSDVEEALQKAKINAKVILAKKLDPITTERQLNHNFNKVRDVAVNIVNHGMMTGEHNSFTALAGSGSKGSPLNLLQIVGCLGQQNVQGDRIPSTISADTRVIPHFPKNDPSPEAHGLITDSFLKGLSPGSQWHHCTSSREGVIVTGTETSVSGYIQKQTCKKTGDLSVYYDGSVRNAQGKIFTFLYGGDGLSAKYSVRTGGEEMWCHLPHIINTADYLYRSSGATVTSKPRKPTLEEAKAMVSYLYASSERFRESPVVARATEVIRERMRKALMATEMRPEVMGAVAAEISKALEIAKAKMGDAVGLMAGLSCGETTTQMTLNVFQNAGNSEKNVTLGIPRLNELIHSSSKLPKNNQNTAVVYLRDPYVDYLSRSVSRSADRREVGAPTSTEELEVLEHLRDMAMSLVALELKDVVETTTIFRIGEYDPERESPMSDENSYATYQPPDWMSADVSSSIEGWVVQLDLKPQAVYDYALDLETIATEVNSAVQGVTVINSPRWACQLVVTIDFRMIRSFAASKLKELSPTPRNRTLLTPDRLDFFITRDVVVGMCLSVKIQGIDGITKGYVRKEVRSPTSPSSSSEASSSSSSVPSEEWVIDTQGSNFSKLLAVDWVDPTRTISDSPSEIYATLGVEATRIFLIRELQKVVCFDGAVVSTRHFEIIADSMTQGGAVTPVSAPGIDRATGPTTKGMFAKPIDNWTHSAVMGEYDDSLTNDVAIFTGVPPALGTGTAKAILTTGGPPRGRDGATYSRARAPAVRSVGT